MPTLVGFTTLARVSDGDGSLRHAFARSPPPLATRAALRPPRRADRRRSGDLSAVARTLRRSNSCRSCCSRACTGCSSTSPDSALAELLPEPHAAGSGVEIAPGRPVSRVPRVLRRATSSDSPTCSRTRSTQTNEVGRCAIVPAGPRPRRRRGRPAGARRRRQQRRAHLLLDRYEYRYEPGASRRRPVTGRARRAARGRRPGSRPVPARRRPDRSRPVADRRHRPRRGAVARGVRVARPARSVPPPPRRDRPGADRRRPPCAPATPSRTSPTTIALVAGDGHPS